MLICTIFKNKPYNFKFYPVYRIPSILLLKQYYLNSILSLIQKQKELKRNHHIMLCLNDMEYDIVTENAQTANLPVAEYARKQIMNQRITLKYEVVADVPKLKN